MGWSERIQDQYRPKSGRGVSGISEPLECRKIVPHRERHIGSPSCVPLHTEKNRGSCMHLLFSLESLQGTGASPKGIQVSILNRQCPEDCRNYCHAGNCQTGEQRHGHKNPMHHGGGEGHRLPHRHRRLAG